MQTGRSKTILICEDDQNLRQLVRVILGEEYRFVEANNGHEALELAVEVRPDLIILDLMLPGLSGLEVCRRLRATTDVPIVMLTARDDEIDRVLGLEMGADDYVGKPFAPRELVARVRAILRRTDGTARADAGVLLAGDVEVDMKRREVRRGAEVIPLATREFDLLRYLAENAGLALTRQQLLDGVWGHGWYGDERTVDVHVRQLRKKLGPGLPLATVWGVGYRLS